MMRCQGSGEKRVNLAYSHYIFNKESDFVQKMRGEAKMLGMDPETIKNKYIMKLDLR